MNDQPATATATRHQPSSPPVDVIKGAFLGDYAKALGVPGYLTQGALGFMPGIGSVCAFRDLLANMGKGDGMGIALNALSLVPVLGGFPKTAHILRAMKNVGQVYGTSANVRTAMKK